MTVIEHPFAPRPGSSLGNLLFLGSDERVQCGNSILQFVKEHDSNLNFPQKVRLWQKFYFVFDLLFAN